MEIYFAGHIPYWAGGSDSFGMRHYLATYADLQNRTTASQFMGYFNDKPNIDLFLDSGAYSAMTIGVKLNLHEYISFINRYGHLFKIIASLDVVHNAPKTYENYLDIKKHVKHRVIPTFHHKEPWEYLDLYAASTDYMAIGGMTDITMRERIQYTLKVATRAREINPTIKIHVFGLGRMPTIKRIGHVIDSVDTTDWLYPIKWALIRNRPKLEKNELNRHQLEKFLRHEIWQFTKLENNINEFNYLRMNGEAKPEIKTSA